MPQVHFCAEPGQAEPPLAMIYINLFDAALKELTMVTQTVTNKGAEKIVLLEPIISSHFAVTEV